MKTNHAEPIDRLIRSYEATMQFITFMMWLWRRGDTDGRFTDPFWQRIFNGPVKNWKDLRKALLRIHSDGFDNEKFAGPSITEHALSQKEFEFGQSRMIASRVAEWTRSSRRVYFVPTDLQLLLSTTSLKDVDWSMINWPFDSFLISFEIPVKHRGKQIDSVLVSKERVGEHKIMVIETIATDLPTIESVFVGNQIQRIETALRKEDFEYASEKLGGAYTNRLAIGGGDIWLASEKTFKPGGLAEKFENLGEDPESKIIFRLMFGLLLYLQSRPHKELAPKGWEPSAFERCEGPAKVIRIESEVCIVKSIYKLTDTERSVLGPALRGGYVEVSPHHREGHWRRPPGKGDDPNHPKTVWVRPTIVRGDKLVDGTLPVGSSEVV